jgi:hypothetical protein
MCTREYIKTNKHQTEHFFLKFVPWRPAKTTQLVRLYIVIPGIKVSCIVYTIRKIYITKVEMYW